MSPIAFTGDKEAAKQDTNFPVAPAGTYYLKVRNAQEKISKTSGRPMIAVEYVIAEGEYADRVHVFNYLTFIEAGAKGHGMTLHALKAHGLPWEGDIEISAGDFSGITVQAELEIENYQGKDKNVVKKFLLVEEPAAEEAPAEDPNGTAQEEPEVISPKESALVAAAKKAGLVKPETKPRTVVKPAAPVAAKKPLPWAKKK